MYFIRNVLCQGDFAAFWLLWGHFKPPANATDFYVPIICFNFHFNCANILDLIGTFSNKLKKYSVSIVLTFHCSNKLFNWSLQQKLFLVTIRIFFLIVIIGKNNFQNKIPYTVFPRIVSSLEYFPSFNSFLIPVRKLFKFLLHKGKLNAETIWIFQGFTIPKKNTVFT